jgi:hypothetical protein
VPISEGVGDYDELLREAVRVALRKEMNPGCDDRDDLYECIRRLMDAYIPSPEGEGVCTLMIFQSCVGLFTQVVRSRKLGIQPCAGLSLLKRSFCSSLRDA